MDNKDIKYKVTDAQLGNHPVKSVKPSRGRVNIQLGHYRIFIIFVWKKLRSGMCNTDPSQKKSVGSKPPEWYAVYTKPHAEKQVFNRLEEAGIEVFLPLLKTIRKWSDRKKIIEKPLLSSYVFVKVKRRQFPSVYRTYGIVKFVTFEGNPVPIPQCQIDNLRLLVNSDAEIEVTGDKFKPGDMVEVVSGSLAGLKGELTGRGGRKRMIIRIDEIGKNIIVKIPVTFLKKIKA